MVIPCLSSIYHFKPFHKNKYKDLFGMLIYRIDEGVETNCDEYSSVESEISTDPKDDAI